MSEMPQPSTEKAQPPGPAEHGRETGHVADGMSFPAGGWRSSIPAGMMRDSGHRRSRFGKGMSCLQGNGPVFTEGGKAETFQEEAEDVGGCIPMHKTGMSNEGGRRDRRRTTGFIIQPSSVVFKKDRSKKEVNLST